MDTNQDQLFLGLNIDEPIKSHLNEAAKWGKFLAIMGFIICGLIVIVGIVVATSVNNIPGYNKLYNRNTMQGLGTVMAIVYIFIALIYFFPCLFLLRFSDKMRTALSTNDQFTFTKSFQNLKIMFRFVGILTIVIISIYLLAFIVGALTGPR